jgi:rifampicin phosphotransferase
MIQATAAPKTLSWDPPGPGSWTLLADHYTRPLTAAMQPFTEVWSTATTEFLTELGVPIREARMATVNGLPYIAFVTDGSAGSKPPPAWVMKLAVRLVPSLRRAEKQLSQTYARKPWIEGIRRWYEVDRPRAVERVSAVARIDPDGLDDAALAAHLRECSHEMFASARQHLLLHAHDMVPPLLFAVRMTDWGFDHVQAFALLAGSSPASTGMSDELRALRAAVSGRDAGSLDELRDLGPGVGAALDAFLERHAWRLVDGYDVDSNCIIELPGLVLRLATGAQLADASHEREAAVQRVRDRVPARYRDEFDTRLEESREAYGLRDDNSEILVAWPTGLTRRAMLASGRRLAGNGKLPHPGLAIEASIEELASALEGSPIDVAALEAVAAHRRAVRSADAPRTLGPPEPPLPVNLPGALGLTMRAMAITESVSPAGDEPLKGLGIGSHAYEGRARLVTEPGEGLDEFEPGDVLVAPFTSPTYNVVLSLAGALVTEEGDSLSHAAIMARELSIPAVVGAFRATTAIANGDLVRVDPAAGVVTVVGTTT